MDARISALCLALVSVLSADVTASAAADLTAGEVRLTLSSRGTSALPIDGQTIAEHACGTTLPQSTPMAHCRLTMGIDRNKPVTMAIPTLTGTPFPQLLEWQAIGLDLAGTRPVESSCGDWDVSLHLDDSDDQPISVVYLRADLDEESGHFVSLLEIRARLRLVNPASPLVIDEPLVLGLSLAGDWRMASPSEKTLSNLLLFANREEIRCFPIWVVERSEFLAPFVEDECQICFFGDLESSTVGVPK